MSKLKISPDFTVDDIHNLRVYIGEIYRSMPKEEAEKDFNMYYQRGEKTIEDLRRLNR
jgi:hypothetical protein